MSETSNVIEVTDLVRSYGKIDAVNGLNLRVQRGRCYGFFGRNGAGKTTTIKCLLNLLKPASGTIRVFGRDPRKQEVEIKSRVSYVPDAMAFYPWMTVQQYFDYLVSFRAHWNRQLEQDLLRQFGLDAKRKVFSLSKGEKMQVALIGALGPEPELLILDEPTSGLDPLVRREFIRTIIGAYQDGDPGNRTVFVSTHLITEFEGLIDEFAVMDQGKVLLNLETEIARQQFKRLRVRFNGEPPEMKHSAIVHTQRNGRESEILINGQEREVCADIGRSRCPSKRFRWRKSFWPR